MTVMFSGEQKTVESGGVIAIGAIPGRWIVADDRQQLPEASALTAVGRGRAERGRPGVTARARAVRDGSRDRDSRVSPVGCSGLTTA